MMMFLQGEPWKSDKCLKRNSGRAKILLYFLKIKLNQNFNEKLRRRWKQLVLRTDYSNTKSNS